jgi:pyroglutamyl-peptidase
MKKILLTGFEPFDNHTTNSSETIVKALVERLKFDSLILPVSYKSSIQALNQHLGKKKYDFILMFGQADRERVCLERVALNLKDAKIPDCDGIFASGDRIDSKGENAIFSELPLSQWIENSEMIISNSAGTYVCNLLYYKVLQGSYGKKCLFVHLPILKKNKKKEEKIIKDLLQLIQCL